MLTINFCIWLTSISVGLCPPRLMAAWMDWSKFHMIIQFFRELKKFFLETFLRHGAQNEQNKYCPRCIDGHSWICFMKTWLCFSAKPLKESGQIWRFMFLTNPLKESRQTTLQETYSCWRMVSSYFALILCFISPAAIHKRCFRFCSSRKRQTPPWTLVPRQCTLWEVSHFSRLFSASYEVPHLGLGTNLMIPLITMKITIYKSQNGLRMP